MYSDYRMFNSNYCGFYFGQHPIVLSSVNIAVFTDINYIDMRLFGSHITRNINARDPYKLIISPECRTLWIPLLKCFLFINRNPTSNNKVSISLMGFNPKNLFTYDKDTITMEGSSVEFPVNIDILTNTLTLFFKAVFNINVDFDDDTYKKLWDFYKIKLSAFIPTNTDNINNLPIDDRPELRYVPILIRDRYVEPTFSGKWVSHDLAPSRNIDLKRFDNVTNMLTKYIEKYNIPVPNFDDIFNETTTWVYSMMYDNLKDLNSSTSKWSSPSGNVFENIINLNHDVSAEWDKRSIFKRLDHYSI